MKIYIFALVALIFISCKQENKQDYEVDSKLASLQIKQTFDRKNSSLINNQSDSLSTIIHPQAIYGHSNCWVQSADELINNQPSDSLTYLSIEIEEIEINAIGSTGIVSGIGHFIGIYKQDTFDLHLCFVETYAFVNDTWMLVGRQAAKVLND